VECQIVKKEWSYTSTLPYVSMRDNMAFVWLTVIRNVLKYLSVYKDLVAVVKPCFIFRFLDGCYWYFFSVHPDKCLDSISNHKGNVEVMLFRCMP
jgi:hypothetical protein